MIRLFRTRTLIIISLLIFYVFCGFFCCGSSQTGNKGPLFFQVHFTNPLNSISIGDAKKILNGDSSILKIAGNNGKKIKCHIFVDSHIEKTVRENYPNLEFTVKDFNRSDNAGNRCFLGISDLRGLKPYYKILYIDNVLPWGRLKEDYSIDKKAGYALSLDGLNKWNDKSHITVVQTGVTAMTRAFMREVERHGDMNLPVKLTRSITSSSDIAMTSNEVSFLDPCTFPLPDRMLFCSPEKYFSILEDSGFDIIELTGNHNNDYGREYNLNTMGMIEKAGMYYFGGGRNLEDSLQIRYIKVKGVTFAFLGFNQWGPKNAWADKNRPGAARLTEKRFFSAVREAVKKADVVFVSVQWGNENSPVPHKIQKDYFRRAAEMGACIMVSSSAHRAMGMEFHNGRFISYGLGNFLFDQMHSINHRRGLIARHHFYGSRHISTELIPYLIHDYSRPVPVHGKEAEQLFDYVFRYSLGNVFRK